MLVATPAPVTIEDWRAVVDRLHGPSLTHMQLVCREWTARMLYDIAREIHSGRGCECTVKTALCAILQRSGVTWSDEAIAHAARDLYDILASLDQRS